MPETQSHKPFELTPEQAEQLEAYVNVLKSIITGLIPANVMPVQVQGKFAVALCPVRPGKEEGTVDYGILMIAPVEGIVLQTPDGDIIEPIDAVGMYRAAKARQLAELQEKLDQESGPGPKPKGIILQ